MIVANRTLHYRDGASDIPIAVNIHAPAEAERCWECRFEIDWPDAKSSKVVRGIDGIQALYLAMQRIAEEVYGSAYHRNGALRWERPGSGYGFPAMKDSYGDLVGEDRIDQVPD